jgi:general secretion pathway protein A
MYKEFYGFTTYPFSITPDPQFLYLSKTHESCLRYLLYSLARGHGLIVLTGETGTGKTLLLKHLTKNLDRKIHAAFLVNSALDSNGMLSYIFHELDLDVAGKSKFEMLSSLKNFLLALGIVNEKVLIIIDEAQCLSIDTLENLRQLTNFENSGKQVLQIILAGQPHLEDILRLPELIQLNQRIGFHCCLIPMDYYETKGYIEKRLAVSGVTYPVFTSRAIKSIFVCSKGVPRVINSLCDNALLFGFGHRKRKIGSAIIQQVAQELHLDGMEQVEKQQGRSVFRRARRLVLITGIVSLSLLGVGFVLQPALTGGKLREHTGKSIASPLAILPPNAGVREPLLLPPNAGVREPLLLPHHPGVRDLSLLPQNPSIDAQPKKVQWLQTTLSYQLPTGTPLTMSLPQLQRTPEDLPVTVTLHVSDSTPTWLTFDPAKLVLSGTAPLQDTGKTYHLTFRAQTTDGLESLLQLVVTLRGQTRP